MNFDFLSLEKINICENMEETFLAIATKLLNSTQLIIGENTYVLEEIEFYLSCSKHPDIFTHGHQLQKTCGRWYFHRTGNGYKSGTFKGLDITFGSENIFAGILIRSIRDSNNTLINGPCLCVETILKETKTSQVATLDEKVGVKKIWDSSSPLYLEITEQKNKEIIQTARVGLSLKQAKNESLEKYIVKPYRFLTSPSEIKKGKLHTVLALYIAGKSAEEIHTITKTPKKHIQNYIEYYKQGKSMQNFDCYYGKDLSSEYISKLHGTFSATLQNN